MGLCYEWGPPGVGVGPAAFIIYINDLDTGITSDVSKFADDTKIGRVIQSDHDASVLKDELDTLWLGGEVANGIQCREV